MTETTMHIAAKTGLVLLLISCLFPVPANPKDDRSQRRDGAFICGTDPQRDRDAIARGRYRNALLQREKSRRLAAALPDETYRASSADIGDVVVMEDNGTLITQANNFNLYGRSFRFEPAGPAAYRVAATSGSYNPTGGRAIRLADDDTSRQDLGFPFPFYGKTYAAIQLNSDGNLTFNQGDTQSSERDLGRFSAGPPRIGPLFADLDPSARGTVSVRTDSDGVVFIWDTVPVWLEQGISSQTNSFSVKLFPNGNIEFVYSSQIGANDAVVGISPGNNENGITPLSFITDLPANSLSGTIAEVFTIRAKISETGVAQKFFETHKDVFDHLTVFLDFDFDLGGGAYAYELGVKNAIRGIGLKQIDFTAEFGSKGRLSSFLNMGTLTGSSRYPDDPNRVFLGTNSTMGIMGQESGHRWLVFTPFRDGLTDSRAILGRDNAHWSFFYNSESSVMEGNKIDDRGSGNGITRFLTVSATTTYSPLDQYIMGLRAKEEVPPSFLVLNPFGTLRNPSSNPALAISFGGERKDITIENIIEANGPRIPSVLQSPKVFRQAFVLLTQKGKTATPDQIRKVQRIRDAWVDFFNTQTDRRGWILTNLQDTPPTTPTDLWFPSFQGKSSRYTGIALANWGATPVDVDFTAYDNSGNPLSSPASIVNPRVLTIPPGAQIAMLAEQVHLLDLGGPHNGWIQAHSTSSQVSGFFLEGDVDQNLLTGAVAGSQTQALLYFTRAQAGAGILIGKNYSDLISVANPNAQAAQLNFRLLDEFGKAAGLASRTVPPFGRLAENLLSLFPSLGSRSLAGYIELKSNVGVVGYQSLDAGSTAFSLPAQPANAAARLYSAQFASGSVGGLRYFTELNLINTSVETRNLQISLIGNDGFPVGEIANPARLSLAPGSQVRSRGESLFGLPNAALATNLVEGSLLITADGPGVLGDLVFGDPIGERFVAALPLESAPSSNLILSQVAQGSAGGGRPYFTGIAIYNPNTVDVSVKVDVFSERGANTGTTTVRLPTGGRISKTLPQLIPAITEQVRGYVRLASSGGPIVCFELFGDQALGFLAPVPPQPITP